MLTRRTDLNDSVFLWWKMHNTFMSVLYLKSASNLNGNLNCSKELEHYAS